MPLASAGKYRHVGIPAVRQFAAQARSQLSARSGNAFAYASSASIPLGFVAARRASTASRKCASAASGTRNGGSIGQPSVCLVFRTSSTPSGEPCASKLSCLRRSVADVRAHEDQRRPRRFGARGSQRRVDRSDVVAVGDAQRVPAVGFEALGAIFGERDVGAGGERDVSCRRRGRSACRAADGRPATPLPTATPSIRSPSLTMA